MVAETRTTFVYPNGKLTTVQPNLPDPFDSINLAVFVFAVEYRQAQTRFIFCRDHSDNLNFLKFRLIGGNSHG